MRNGGLPFICCLGEASWASTLLGWVLGGPLFVLVIIYFFMR
jgi:hypothetical protein